MKDFKQKIKSYSFWTALSGAVVIFLGTISKVLGLSLNSQIAEDIIMGVCGVLVALGVVCAPIKTDTKEEEIEKQTSNTKLSNEENELKYESKDKDAQEKAEE